MIPGQIERNLLVLLDPAGETEESAWNFIPWRSRRDVSRDTASGATKTIYCFDRRDIVGFMLFGWHARKEGLSRWRKVLYVNDGLFSAIFDADKTAGYVALAPGRRLPPRGFKQKVAYLLPLALRAEKRYVLVEQAIMNGAITGTEELAALVSANVMFFANAGGKLLFATVKTLETGKGVVIKTTANPEYAEAMDKEFSALCSIQDGPGRTGLAPRTGERFAIGHRVFFSEEYVGGRSLREVLRNLSRRNDIGSICRVLDRLDRWFRDYMSAFTAQQHSLTSCYQHVFDAFNEVHGAHPLADRILARAGGILSDIARSHADVIAITANNDLWPDNFVVGPERLVAIDWERAAEGRAPLFDYYWMIISATLEYLVCRVGVVEYSRAFRRFLRGRDEVSLHAREKLMAFLDTLAFERDRYLEFLFLFLMEWSVQGHMVLHDQTAMDKLAFGELVSFAKAGLGRGL